MNKRFLYGMICVVLAAVIAFGGIPLLASRANSKITVVQVVSPISKGSVIKADNLSLVEVGGYGLAPGTITTLKDVAGQYAATDLVKGSELLPGNISRTPISTDTFLSSLPAGKMAVSFTVKSLANGLSDKLQGGDIIRIYDAGSAVPELQYVKVLAVTDSKGVDIDKNNPVASDSDPQQSASILVMASPAQAQIISKLDDEGKIHVALVLRGDDKQADELIAKQDELSASTQP